MPDFNVCGTGSGCLAALESGPACGANFVPSIFGVMVEEMRLGKIALVNDPILLMHSVNPRLNVSIAGGAQQHCEAHL